MQAFKKSRVLCDIGQVKVNRILDADEIKEIHTSDTDYTANLNRLSNGDKIKEHGDNMLQDRNRVLEMTNLWTL